MQSTYVSPKMLVASDAAPAGTELLSRDGNATTVVTADSIMRFQETDDDTPSGAGRAVTGHAVNGWYFWRLPDGAASWIFEMRTQGRSLMATLP